MDVQVLAHAFSTEGPEIEAQQQELLLPEGITALPASK
jgi:hypothetical protein